MKNNFIIEIDYNIENSLYEAIPTPFPYFFFVTGYGLDILPNYLV